MADSTLQVFVAAFGDEKQAAAALQDFRAMDREGSIELIDAVVVVRDLEGKVTYEETADPSGKRWAKRGAIAGGIVGLIFPPSLIAGAAIGGAAGGLCGPAASRSRNTLRKLRAELSARLMFLSGEVSSKNSTTSQQGHCLE